MMSKTSRYLLSVMVMGIFVLFASTSVVKAGDCDAPLICDKDGWIVTLESIKPVICPVDEPCPDEYRWTYRVIEYETGDAKALSQLNFTIPVTCPLATGFIEPQDDGVFVYDPGAGDPTTEFGWGIEHMYVVKFTPQKDGYWSFTANTDKMSTGTYGLKAGKLFSNCTIAVPDINGDDPNAIFTVGVVQDILTSDGRKFHIEEDPDTQCITSAYEIEEDGTHTHLTSIPIGQIFQSYGGDWTAKMEFLGSINQKCHRAIGKSEGDNTWYFISGRRVWR